MSTGLPEKHEGSSGGRWITRLPEEEPLPVHGSPTTKKLPSSFLLLPSLKGGCAGMQQVQWKWRKAVIKRARREGLELRRNWICNSPEAALAWQLLAVGASPVIMFNRRRQVGKEEGRWVAAARVSWLKGSREEDGLRGKDGFLKPYHGRVMGIYSQPPSRVHYLAAPFKSSILGINTPFFQYLNIVHILTAINEESDNPTNPVTSINLIFLIKTDN